MCKVRIIMSCETLLTHNKYLFLHCDMVYSHGPDIHIYSDI